MKTQTHRAGPRGRTRHRVRGPGEAAARRRRMDETAKAAAEEKKAKDAEAAEKAKAAQAAAEDKAVKNFQGNMKKAGKPIPKPTPIVAPLRRAGQAGAAKAAAPAKAPRESRAGEEVLTARRPTMHARPILPLLAAALLAAGCAYHRGALPGPTAVGQARAHQGQRDVPGRSLSSSAARKRAGLRHGHGPQAQRRARLPRAREGRLQLGRRHERGRALQSARQAATAT